jgi:hypothetical protein
VPLFTCKKAITLIAKAANIVALAIKPDAPFDKIFLPKPVIRKPIKGSRGMRQINTLFIKEIIDNRF